MGRSCFLPHCKDSNGQIGEISLSPIGMKNFHHITYCLLSAEGNEKHCKKSKGLTNIKVVPGAGLEPAQCLHRWILNPLRLPISPPGLEGILYLSKQILPNLSDLYKRRQVVFSFLVSFRSRFLVCKANETVRIRL